MFVRTKKVKNKQYAYLVENTWTKKGTRQKVKKYLGKVIKPNRKKENNFLVEKTRNYEETIKELIKHELSNHDVTKNDEKSVIFMNEGFLCKETVKELIKLTPEKENRTDKEGERLAIKLLEAGLKVKKEEFSKLFEIWQNNGVLKI